MRQLEDKNNLLQYAVLVNGQARGCASPDGRTTAVCSVHQRAAADHAALAEVPCQPCSQAV